MKTFCQKFFFFIIIILMTFLRPISDYGWTLQSCNLFDRDNLDNLIAARFDEYLIKLISVSLSSVKWLPFSSTYLFHRAINGLKHNSIIFLCFRTRYCLYSIYPHDVNIPMCTSSKVCNLIFFQKTFVRSLGMWNWL